MIVLVTGARGQLGLSFQKIAGEWPGYKFVFTDLPEADITDRESMAALLHSTNAGVIINCAAYTAVDRAESDESLCRKINAQGPAVLADLANKMGLKLIHISTDYVFDGHGSRPLREDDRTSPQSVYGQTKLEGEEIITASGADAAIIRTSWLYSEFGANFVKTMLRLAQSNATVRVVSDQHGTPTYAPDLAQAIMMLIQKGVGKTEIYHYSNAGETVWSDFAKEIFRLAGKATIVEPITTAQYPTAAARPAYSVLDKTKIMSRGVSVAQWQDSLAECIKEIEKL